MEDEHPRALHGHLAAEVMQPLLRPDEIGTVRVDLPRPDGSVRFFFIRHADEHESHPWWGQVFRYLTGVPSRTYAGLNEDGIQMDVALMEGEVRSRFLELLMTAPESEVSRHRTLRFARKFLSERDFAVPVRFFGYLTTG